MVYLKIDSEQKANCPLVSQLPRASCPYGIVYFCMEQNKKSEKGRTIVEFILSDDMVNKYCNCPNYQTCPIFQASNQAQIWLSGATAIVPRNS